MDRERQIVRASVISIVGNVILAITKGAVGVVTGSIAIALDAINSLTDALASVIAVIGARLAGKAANRSHPFGYGRMEYLSSIVIAALILSAGISSFTESVRSIMHPTDPQYSVVSLIIVAGAALVKFALGFYLLRVGKRTNSGSLVGSGTDSLMDGGVSTATFVAGILFFVAGIRIESWLAAGISILITRSGVLLLIETASKLLGERVKPEVAARVEQEARAIDAVRLASGVVLLDFGPEQIAGAMHVTVDGRMTVAEFDNVARAVQSRVFQKCGVTLAGVTPYPDASYNDDVQELRATVGRIVWRRDHVVDMRGLYIDVDAQTVRFDAVVDFEVEDLKELRAQIIAACEKDCPGWTFDVRVLPDVGD
ncbi:MAG: cation transporter [Atopobiaceae bacterium]|nr:cation transporter [Atopobiaceae bacterium]